MNTRIIIHTKTIRNGDDVRFNLQNILYTNTKPIGTYTNNNTIYFIRINWSKMLGFYKYLNIISNYFNITAFYMQIFANSQYKILFYVMFVYSIENCVNALL